MKRSIICSVISLTLFLLGTGVSYASAVLPDSYGSATHQDPEWQRLATYQNGVKTDSYGVFWSVDGGSTWGRETDLRLNVGDEIQFMFNMHKKSVGTHYADYLKAWVDWGQDGKFDPADTVAFGYQELKTNESGNMGSYNTPRVPDYTFYSGLFAITDAMYGDLYLRARVTCSHSLVDDWDDQWEEDESYYREEFLPTGHLHQGEVEEWALSVKPTPIPGAVWLLGSGLLGLVGIRRKMKK